MSYYKFTTVCGRRDGELIAHSLRGHWKTESLVKYCARHNLSDPSADHHTYDMSGHGRSDSSKVTLNA